MSKTSLMFTKRVNANLHFTYTFIYIYHVFTMIHKRHVYTQACTSAHTHTHTHSYTHTHALTCTQAWVYAYAQIYISAHVHGMTLWTKLIQQQLAAYFHNDSKWILSCRHSTNSRFQLSLTKINQIISCISYEANSNITKHILYLHNWQTHALSECSLRHDLHAYICMYTHTHTYIYTQSYTMHSYYKFLKRVLAHKHTHPHTHTHTHRALSLYVNMSVVMLCGTKTCLLLHSF